MRLQGAHVAITGASSGIGASMAEAFARAGCRLALAARREDALQDVAERARAAGAPEVRTRRVDVTRDAELQAWTDELAKAWDGKLEVVVANAGVGHYGPFLDMRPEHLDQLLRTNVLGVWRTIQVMGPMLEAAHGRAVVVGSVAGRVPLPYLSTYCATKAALQMWSRSARPELRKRGIGLTLVAPGATRTAFARRALREREVKGKDLEERGSLDSYVGMGWRPERVARATVRAVQMGRREIHLTVAGRAGEALAAVAPHLLARAAEPWMRPRKKGGGAGNWKQP
jgi:short-subunit dehydrogenase